MAVDPAKLEDGWERFSSVDRAMARRMERTVDVPLSSEFTHVDIVAAMAEVDRLRGEGVPATFTSVVLAATARGLAAHPEVAAEVDYEDWLKRLPDSPAVGVAVASSRGLVVPVIRDVLDRTIEELSVELDGTVKAVRDGSADPSLFSGGHFSITNIGSMPIYGGMPLPNTPQPAILGVSSSWDAAVVRDGEVAVSKMARLTITLDHRAMDGIKAAQFLVEVKDHVEDPGRLAGVARDYAEEARA